MLYEGVVINYHYGEEEDQELIYGPEFVFAKNDETAKQKILVMADRDLGTDKDGDPIVDVETATVLVRPFK